MTTPDREQALGGWQTIDTHDGSSDPVVLFFPEFAPLGVTIGFYRAPADGCYYPGQWLDDLNNEPFEIDQGEVFPTHWQPLPAAPDTVSTDEQVGIAAGDEPKSPTTTELSNNLGQLNPDEGRGLREAAEIVDEWLAMVGTFTPANLSRVRHVPVCQSEVEAIREILAALRGEG